MNNVIWNNTKHFLPEPGTYWVKVDDIPRLAELKKGWWTKKWFKEGIRIYPTHWANV
jgi:hypothetical protein